jgi:hypothetical protein
MKWQIREFIFDSTHKTLARSAESATSGPKKLSPSQAAILRLLIEKYNKEYEEEEFLRWAGPIDVYSAVSGLRKMIGREGKAYISTRPHRLIARPIKLDDPDYFDDAHDVRAGGMPMPATLVVRADVANGSRSVVDKNAAEPAPEQERFSPVARLDIRIPTEGATVDPAPESAGPGTVWNENRLDITSPTPAALAFAEAFGALQDRIVGDVIEAYGHSNLSSDLPLDQLGWSPSEITLRFQRERFDAGELLNDPQIVRAFQLSEAQRIGNGDGTALAGTNGVKYTIVDVSSPFLDNTDLTVTLRSTDYFTIRTVHPGLLQDPQARIRFGNIDPTKTRIPQATAVAFVALFADDRVLTIRRAKDTYLWSETWSMSGEEQVAEIDAAWAETERMKRFLLRTTIEEIFPLARVPDQSRMLRAMDRIEPYIKSMRTWSLIVEESTSVLQFFSVVDLSLSSAEYARLAKEIVQPGDGKFSKEGSYYSILSSEIANLLGGETITATPIFGGEPTGCSPHELHKTSAYRLRSLWDYSLQNLR